MEDQDNAINHSSATHDYTDAGEDGECASYSMSWEEDDDLDDLEQEVSLTKLLVDLPLPVQHELMLEESKRSIQVRRLSSSDRDHQLPHKYYNREDTHSIQTGDDTVEDDFSCSEDTEDQFYRAAVDWDSKKEMETRKAALVAVLGGSGMGFMMSKVTLLVKFFARLFFSGGDDTMAVLVDVGGDPAENAAMMKFMGQEMAVQASKSAGSAMASGTSSSAVTSSLGALGTTAVGTSSGTVAMVTAATIVAAVASMMLMDTPPTIIHAMNNTNICLSDSPHEFKHGYIQLGLKLANSEIIVDKRGALEDMFLNVYHEVITPCEGDYERVLQRAELFHADLDLQEEQEMNDTTATTTANSFTKVYTQWVAQVSCNGCLDFEPLFTSSAVLDGYAHLGPDHNETEGSLRRRSLFHGDHPETQQVLLQNNTLFRQFVASYNVAIRREEQFQNEVYFVYYGALLSPDGDLVEEVVLEEVITESRDLLPPPSSAPTTGSPRPRTVVASMEWSPPPTGAPTTVAPKPRTVVASMEWLPPPTSAPSGKSPSKSRSKSKSKSGKSSSSSSSSSSSKMKSKGSVSGTRTSKSKMSLMSSSASSSDSQKMMGMMGRSSRTVQRLDPFQ